VHLAAGRRTREAYSVLTLFLSVLYESCRFIVVNNKLVVCFNFPFETVFQIFELNLYLNNLSCQLVNYM
jgi:hypothetical protein